MIALVHLVWAPLGTEPFKTFLESLKRHDPGAPYRLVVLFNGFSEITGLDEYRRLLRGHDAEEIFLAEPQLDIAAYRTAAMKLGDRRVCFVNSYSEVIAPDWLGLMAQGLAVGSVKVAGATGSWGSQRSFLVSRIGLPGAYGSSLGDRDVVNTAFASPNSSAAKPKLKDRLTGAVGVAGGFDGFPAPHIRTNALLVEREFFLGVEFGDLATKRGTYRFESGRNSLTNQVMASGNSVALVGKSGAVTNWRSWPERDVFWQGGQGDLLVADNQTRAYARAGLAHRASMAAFAWGDKAAPLGVAA